jgi:hypothetical protein
MLKVSDKVVLTREQKVPLTGPDYLMIEENTIGTIECNGFRKNTFMVRFQLLGTLSVIIQVPIDAMDTIEAREKAVNSSQLGTKK